MEIFQIPKYDPQTGEINPYYAELTGKDDINQLEIPFEYQTNVDFVNEVEEFNRTFGKPNNYEPTIPEKKEWQFVYDFILEELEEYKEACERGDIVEILDALCYMALRIRYGQHIKKYKHQICLRLVKLKEKQYKLSPKELRNKVRSVIMKK